MHAMLATPCWTPPSTVLRVCLDEMTASRRQTLQELRALLAEIAAPSEGHGCEPADLPTELDNVLNAWLARRAA